MDCVGVEEEISQTEMLEELEDRKMEINEKMANTDDPVLMKMYNRKLKILDIIRLKVIRGN